MSDLFSDMFADSSLYGFVGIINFIIGGISNIIMIIGLIAYICRVISRRNSVMLVLSKLSITPAGETKIFIEGRKSGFWQWVLTLINLSTRYTIEVKQSDITFTADKDKLGSLSLTPMQKIASTFYGAYNPVWYMIFGITLAIDGLNMIFMPKGLSEIPDIAIGTGIACILLGIILAVLYFFNKSHLISIRTFGGNDYMFFFKRRITENAEANTDRAEEAITLINNLLLEAQ